MPNRLGKGQNLTEEFKYRIVFLAEQGISQRNIATILSMNKNTVTNTLKKWKETGSVAQKRGQGRRKKTTVRERRLIIRYSLGDRRLTSSDLSNIVNLNKPNPVTSRTVRSILQKYGLRGCIAAKKPLLSAANIVKRFNFAKRYRHWSAARWNLVLFSDESSFELFAQKFRIPIRRRINEKYKAECLQPTVKHSGGTTMVWGCMSGYGLGNLVLLEGIINKEKYLKLIQENIISSARAIGFPNGKFIYQEDNAPVHTAKVVQSWLQQQEFPKLQWPPQSPDMSPIETLWREIKKLVRNSKPRNKRELVTVIFDKWNSFPQDKITQLCDSMPRRLQALYKARGGHTKW